MGSYNMSCSITGYPFCYSQKKGVIIPVLSKVTRSRKPLYVKESLKFFPFYLAATYDDSGTFEIDDSPLATKTLAYIHKVITAYPTENKCEVQLPEKVEDFTWEMFFEMCDEEFNVGNHHRISYVAIHKNTLDTILTDYTIHGMLDESVRTYQSDNYGDYHFEHFLKKRIAKEAKIKAEIDKKNQNYIDIINDPDASSDEKLYAQASMFGTEGSVRDIYEYSEDRCFEFRELPKDYNEEEYRNTSVIRFLDVYLSGLNKVWQESMSSGQEIDTTAFQVLRNCLASLTISDRIEFVSENYVDKDFEVLDDIDKKLLSMFDELKTLTPVRQEE